MKPMSYKAIFTIAAAQDLKLEQMRVYTVFFYGDINEEVYVEQPIGQEHRSNLVCCLNKALCRLKQSPRIWFHTLTSFLKELGFIALLADLAVFVWGTLYIAIYVDDLLLAGFSMSEISIIKAKLSARFDMINIGSCTYYLGIPIWHERPMRTLYLSQHEYIERILREFGMWECKPVATPMDSSRFEAPEEGYHCSEACRSWYAKAIGSLMYAMLGTRADIAYSVSVLSRYLANLTPTHVKGAK